MAQKPPISRMLRCRGIFPRHAAPLVILLWVLSGPGSVRAADSLVNRPAPTFSLPDLQDAPIRLAHYRGQVVLLNFWATWCAPCRIEMPRFVEWQRRYGPQGLRVIGVSVDDSDSPVRAFADKLHLNYPVVMGNAGLGERYGGIYGVPVTFLIDRNGIVRARFDGEPDLDLLETRIRSLLALRARPRDDAERDTTRVATEAAPFNPR